MRNGESRDAREARLKDGGRFGEFNERVAVLKHGATNKCERQLAYWKAVAEFLPLSTQKPAPDNGEPEHLVEPAVFRLKTATKQAAIQWAADHIGIRGVEAKDSPSADAWNLLRWVRQTPANEKVFWQAIFPLIVPQRPRFEEDERYADRLPDPAKYKAGLEKIRQIAIEAHGSKAKATAALLIGDPAVYLEIKDQIEEAIVAQAAHWLAVPSVTPEYTAENRALAERIRAALPHLVREPTVIVASKGTPHDEPFNGRRDTVTVKPRDLLPGERR